MKTLATLTACVLLGALPAQTNTNENAPTATAGLAFDKDTDISVSYRSFTVAGGNWLRQLNDRSPAGAQARQFYNERYIPGMLRGSLKVSKEFELAGNPLSAGTYKLVFRIDEDLVWHLVLLTDKDQEICAVPMVTDRDERTAARRLAITPVAAAEGKEGTLSIRFGPLKSDVPFKFGKPAAKADKAEKPAEKRG